MALTPQNKAHGKQIIAGTVGRNKGHSFEKEITDTINSFSVTSIRHLAKLKTDEVLYNGNPASLLLQYVISENKIDTNELESVTAFWLGGLATSGKGDTLLLENGQNVKSSKSDILLRLRFRNNLVKDIGVSTKTCNNKTPTNDQLFFTTASAFCKLLRENGIMVSDLAEQAMKMFCGDKGFRPIDTIDVSKRKSDPDRWFWEELPLASKTELEKLFKNKQDEISEVLFRKAYTNDPFPPDFVLHQTKSYQDIDNVEVALFSISKLIALSKRYLPFDLRSYAVKKGRFKNDPNIHQAPRFGIIQMQRGGQKQHPTQLQFNLKAGYFYHLKGLS
jgi:hypothetical protein